MNSIYQRVMGFFLNIPTEPNVMCCRWSWYIPNIAFQMYGLQIFFPSHRFLISAYNIRLRQKNHKFEVNLVSLLRLCFRIKMKNRVEISCSGKAFAWHGWGTLLNSSTKQQQKLPIDFGSKYHTQNQNFEDSITVH